MKKLLLLLGLFILIVSCNVNNTDYSQINYNDEMTFGDQDFETINDVLIWIEYNIKYVSDDITFESDEYWQSPIQTYEWRVGDCEDYAILAMYMVHVYLDIPPEKIKLVLGVNDTSGHVWIEINGTWYEPQGNIKCDNYKKRYPYIFKLDYSETMKRATTTHKKLNS